MKPGIYVLRDKTNGKMYVGQSAVNVCSRRWHKCGLCLRNPPYVDRAIKKRGWEMFESFIFYVPTCFLDDFERGMIAKLETLHPGGYNLDSGGRSNRRLSRQAKLNMSVAKLGEKNPMFGKPGSMAGRPSFFLGKFHSPETKKRLSEIARQRKHNQETKDKISMALKHRPSPMRGRRLSEEHKQKLRDGFARYWKSRKAA